MFSNLSVYFKIIGVKQLSATSPELRGEAPHYRREPSGHRQVSSTALRHGISASLLFSWQRGFREGRPGGVDVRDLASAMVSPDSVSPSEPASEPAAVGRTEILIGSDLYAVRGRKGDFIKVLWHDSLGLSHYAKRLERGRCVSVVALPHGGLRLRSLGMI